MLIRRRQANQISCVFLDFSGLYVSDLYISKILYIYKYIYIYLKIRRTFFSTIPGLAE